PWILSLLTGIIGVLAGVAVLRHPLLAAIMIPTVLVIVLGVQGLVMGILEIIEGFRGGGAWSFVLGIINILVGLLLLARPSAAALFRRRGRVARLQHAALLRGGSGALRARAQRRLHLPEPGAAQRVSPVDLRPPLERDSWNHLPPARRGRGCMTLFFDHPFLL